MKITLQDIAEQISEQYGTTKKLSEDFLRELFAIIEETLRKGDMVKIKGLGTFKLLSVDERKSVNVQTGEEMIIPAHNKISFTPEKELKTMINKPYSHLETYILSQYGPVDSAPEDEEEDEAPDTTENEKDNPVIIIEQESEQIIIIKEKKQTMSIEKEEQLKVSPEEEAEEITLSKIVESEEEPLPEVVEMNENQPVEPEIIEGEHCEKKKSCKCKWAIAIIILALLALLTWLWWDYSPLTIPAKEEVKTEDSSLVIPDEEEMIDTDQFSDAGMDETAENEDIYGRQDEEDVHGEQKFDQRLLDFMQSSYPNMSLVTYGTPREVVLTAGNRLTLISLEYYGNKQFWVYIYLYNTDIIRNPNNIPVGTVVKVPKLDKSLADPNNQATIDVAKEIQTQLLNM
jgi:nucleoid DNA-binding protein/nucleoid-associated protein YgaU